MIEDYLKLIKSLDEFKTWCSTAPLSNVEYLVGKYSGPHKQVLRTKVFPLCPPLSCYIFDRILRQCQVDRAIEEMLLS